MSYIFSDLSLITISSLLSFVITFIASLKAMYKLSSLSKSNDTAPFTDLLTIDQLIFS